MFEIVVGSIVAVAITFAVIVVIGVVVAILAALFGILILPFQLLAWLLRGLGFLVALPFLIRGGLLLAVVFGVGLLPALIPFLPFVLAFWLVWRLFIRKRRPASA